VAPSRHAETVTTAEGPDGKPRPVPTFVNEFWTSRQRAAHSLHEISYRACFKPHCRGSSSIASRGPAPSSTTVAGRGTTPLEAALPAVCRSRATSTRSAGCCWSPPLSAGDRCGAPPPGRDRPPPRRARSARPGGVLPPATLNEIAALRHYLLDRQRHGALDGVDRWIRMVAVNRLTATRRGSCRSTRCREPGDYGPEPAQNQRGAGTGAAAARPARDRAEEVALRS